MVVETSFDTDSFQTMNLVGNHSLSVDVALVLDKHFGSFDDFLLTVGNLVEHCLERRDIFRDTFNGDLRTDNQVDELASVREWGGS